jgi:hypothetical protein
MDLDLGNRTLAAATAARDAILARPAAVGEREMAAVAQRALFDEALLGAVKARVAELKAVAK